MSAHRLDCMCDVCLGLEPATPAVEQPEPEPEMHHDDPEDDVRADRYFAELETMRERGRE